MSRLLVFATHPIQYIAPVLRDIHQRGVEVVAVYGSDFSVAGYTDQEFGSTFRWDTDLLSGYRSHFLERVETGGAARVQDISGDGIPQTLATYQPDVILLTGYDGKFHRKALVAAVRSGKPILFRAETTDNALRRSSIKTWTRDWFLRGLYSRCSVLLPIGVQSCRHYQRLAPQQPRILAPYCVDTTPFQTDERARHAVRANIRNQLELQKEDVVLLFSGKLIPKKNPLLLINAVKQLPIEYRKRVKVLFLGDGELKEDIETLAQAEPDVTVRFLGFHNQTALSPFYHAADLLVLPSAWGETWGLVVNEALHHGLSVLVSEQVGCAPDLVKDGETGYTFPSESPLALKDTIVKAITTLIQREDTRAICRAVVENYTVASAAAGITRAVQYAISKQ